MRITFEVTGRPQRVLEFIQYSTGISKEEVCIKLITDLLEDRTEYSDAELREFSQLRRERDRQASGDLFYDFKIQKEYDPDLEPEEIVTEIDLSI